MAVRVLPQPTDGLGPVETGAIRFGDDYVGIFIRGDAAYYLANCIHVVLSEIRDSPPDAKLFGQALADIANMIRREILSVAEDELERNSGSSPVRSDSVTEPETESADRSGDAGSAPSKKVKQVLVIRRDLRMRRGMEIAQGAHAAMAFIVDAITASRKSDPHARRVTIEFRPEVWSWLTGRHAKVTLQAPDLETLVRIESEARARGVEVHLVTDLGLTEFAGRPTVTALALGPADSDAIDAITGPGGLLPLELY
jgi:peptidyl-tRNA hydrolase, PTH2 family